MTRFHVIALACGLAAALPAQAPRGVRVSLQSPSIVAARAEVAVRLVVQVDEDAEVPAQLLNGKDLTVRVDGVDREPILDPGRGGAVPLVAGTRVDRVLRLPVASLVGATALGEVALVAVAWRGIPGADCAFKVAPDVRDVKLEELDLGKTEVVLVTNYGDMRVSFRPDKAPRTVENFLRLCLEGFYDGTKFHRVIRDFMIQGGDPLTRDDAAVERWGTGGSGRSVAAEFSDLRHLRGTLSMARETDPDSASSQFFVVHRDSAHLDGAYSAFGNVVEGMDTLDRIAGVPVGGPLRSTPLQPVVLQAAVVLPIRK